MPGDVTEVLYPFTFSARRQGVVETEMEDSSTMQEDIPPVDTSTPPVSVPIPAQVVEEIPPDTIDSTSVVVSGSEIIGEPSVAEKPKGTLNSKKPESDRNTLIQGELKSARDQAVAGAAAYGIGMGVELIGAILFVNDMSNYAKSNSSSTSSSLTAPPLAGVWVVLAGGAISFGGQIACNMGGDRARTIYQTAYDLPPKFEGWNYFVAGLACNIGGSLLSMSNIPVVPTIVSAGGIAFGICSVVHSCTYTNKLYMGSLVLEDVRCLPVVDLTNGKTIGLSVAVTF